MLRLRLWASLVCLAFVTAGLPGRAQTRSAAPPPPPPARKASTDVTCAAELGEGVKTKRRFCDVVITANGAESVTIKIPAHAGAAVLQFDLHNRFDVPTSVLAPRLFARHVATIAIVRSTGAVLDREAVASEFRVAADAFDRIGGGAVDTAADPRGAGSGGTAQPGVKAVAPGPPLAIRVTIPAGVGSIGIVGVKLSATGRTGATEVFETAGRPIAMISNVRVEFTPIK